MKVGRERGHKKSEKGRRGTGVNLCLNRLRSQKVQQGDYGSRAGG